MAEPGLLAWQWSLYPRNHRNRTNLLLHIASVPLFIAGTGALVAAPFVGHWWLAAVAPVAMAGAMAVQGRGHRLEAEPPVPFRGPVDVARRIFAEQLITFPRYVLSGGWSRAWREGGVSSLPTIRQ